jgi:hypothetical protein
MPYVLCDPSSRLNFSHDWETLGWLADDDSIVSRQWTITPMTGTSPETPTLSNDTGEIVYVEGLVAGHVYRLTERVVTEAGVQDERTIVLRCENT